MLYAVIAVPFQGKCYVVETYHDLDSARLCARQHRAELSEGASIEECTSVSDAEAIARTY